MNLSWITDRVVGQVPVGDPHAPCLSVDGRHRLTYLELRERRDRYANALLEMGVTKGDRVGVLLLNSLEYIALYFAIARIGAIAVRLNFRLAPPELRYALSDSGCKVLCLHSDLIDRVAPIRGQVPVSTYVVFPGKDGGTTETPQWARSSRVMESGGAADVPVAEPSPDDGLMLMYSSGTTGRPKGALWTHGNALWFGSMQAMKWRYGPSTAAMTTGPLYHVGAFEDLLLPALLAQGKAVFLSSGGFTVERLVAALRGESVTDVLLYPFMLYDLLRLPDLDENDLGSLRRIVCGGDPIMGWAVAEMERRLPGIELVQAYGLTEGGGMSTCLDHDDCRKHPDSVGRPLPLTEVKVVRENGSPAEPDEVGQVLVRSPSVCAGYWQKPEETEKTFVDGWCHTGDLGRYTPDGFLVLTGRKKDMIRSGGENIYPAEVETVLTSHPDIKEAALVGVPDDRYLEVGCAVLVPDQGGPPSADEVKGYCRERLAGYKCPSHVVYVEELPRNPSGKVLKYVLRERYRDIGKTS
ncbi:MAG: AMP-binding protein [Streptosporangiales bacterium]|nr:AMP-binding protein [Streptosporangiales bacterium]